MKKPLLLAALAAGVAIAVKRRGTGSKADAALWAEATAARNTPTAKD